jgi:hypothetical protein
MHYFLGRETRLAVSDARESGFISIEATGGFAAKPAGGGVLLEERAGAVFWVAQAFVENTHDVEADVETDEVGQLERAHGMVHAEFHDGIHGFGSGDAFHDAVGGFVDERHEDTVGNKTRSVVDGHGSLAELFGELHSGGESGVAGLERANDFDKGHDGNRVHEMHADEAVGALSERGESGHGDGGSVACDDDVGAEDAVGFGEDGAFDFEFFGDGFYDEIGGGNCGHVGRGFHAGENCSLLCFREFTLLDFAVEIFADGIERAVEEALVNITQDDREAGAGEDVGDAVAHGAGSEDGNSFDRVDRQSQSLRVRLKQMRQEKLRK